VIVVVDMYIGFFLNTQRQIKVPGECPDGASMGVVFEDQGEVGVVIQQFAGMT
jgi:hypothetical protein